MDDTLTALSSALSTNKVHLICIRVDDAQSLTKELTQLTQRVMQLVERYHHHNPTTVVVNGNVEAAMEGGAHGVHVKEHRVALDIDTIRLQWPNAVIGTSVHDLKTGVETCTQYNPDYVFCGTCFPTQTHPGKTDLEGPALPGQLASALLQQHQQQQQSTPTRVLAIGGISESNCHIPVQGGAHGVAIIRSILQAPDPALTTQMIWSKLETVGSIQYP
jgi:thiamine-phosphate diphosphorylase